MGEKRPRFTANGVETSMTFQATIGVKKPLVAKGDRIVLGDATSDSHIENKASGVRIPIQLENGVDMMEMLVAEPPVQGPAK